MPLTPRERRDFPWIVVVALLACLAIIVAVAFYG
jgi:hypothetical protein